MESVQRGLIIVNSTYALIGNSEEYNLWICPDGLNEAYYICNRYLDIYLKQKRKKGVLVIVSQKMVSDCKSIIVNEVSQSEMIDIVNWYRVCNPSNERFVMISINQPVGRNGGIWMSEFDDITEEDICRVGILRIRD